jgi:hypothetical protein
VTNWSKYVWRAWTAAAITSAACGLLYIQVDVPGVAMSAPVFGLIVAALSGFAWFLGRATDPEWPSAREDRELDARPAWSEAETRQLSAHHAWEYGVEEPEQRRDPVVAAAVRRIRMPGAAARKARAYLARHGKAKAGRS